MNSQIRESHRNSETPTQRLASVLLGENVKTFVATARDSGLSWRRIAENLKTATHGQVDVTYETVRSWGHGDAA